MNQELKSQSLNKNTISFSFALRSCITLKFQLGLKTQKLESFLLDLYARGDIHIVGFFFCLILL
jgi:hypothetical protein